MYVVLVIHEQNATYSLSWPCVTSGQTFCRCSQWQCHVHGNTGSILSCFLHTDCLYCRNIEGKEKPREMFGSWLKSGCKNLVWNGDNQSSLSSPVHCWSGRRCDQSCSDCSSGSQRQHGRHLSQRRQSGTWQWNSVDRRLRKLLSLLFCSSGPIIVTVSTRSRFPAFTDLTIKTVSCVKVFV